MIRFKKKKKKKNLPFQESRKPNSRNLSNTLKTPNCTSFVNLFQESLIPR
ncbi:hypothetical protein HanXRQr2_Chr11g0509001 [Helianthus annuus]|uniref:Uncharacterized protein n=1 Tax=Helianthus annuus TaxID=4232 RepID=A0A9K3N1J7_HELAN|nr:hypothetical protein HanXRQr2_Chr11g0509001 [Helianthus annuus]